MAPWDRVGVTVRDSFLHIRIHVYKNPYNLLEDIPALISHIDMKAA
jgi:hypothetical protein